MHLAENVDLKGGLVGGAILGLSSTAFLLVTGKITGLSGITEGLIKTCGEDWNWTYLAGLSLSGVILGQVRPESFGATDAYNGLELTQTAVIVAGILTGFGTRLSGGCTSGHGLCGLSRRSPRSFVAVMSFMMSGAAMAYLTRSPGQLHSLVYAPSSAASVQPALSIVQVLTPTIVVLCTMAYSPFKRAITAAATKDKKDDSTGKPSVTTVDPLNSSKEMHITSFASALVFGLGLGLSGMCNPQRVLNFLDFSNPQTGWDPTLACVMGSGVVVTFLGFHYFSTTKQKTLLSDNKVCLGEAIKMGTCSTNTVIDWKLVVGSLIFGAGWGLGGICPGPGIVSLGATMSQAGLFVPAMLVGMKLKGWLIK